MPGAAAMGVPPGHACQVTCQLTHDLGPELSCESDMLVATRADPRASSVGAVLPASRAEARAAMLRPTPADMRTDMLGATLPEPRAATLINVAGQLSAQMLRGMFYLWHGSCYARARGCTH